jgi:hypothetical protein
MKVDCDTLVPLLSSTNMTIKQNLPEAKVDRNEAIKAWQRRHSVVTHSLVFFKPTAVRTPAQVKVKSSLGLTGCNAMETYERVEV